MLCLHTRPCQDWGRSDASGQMRAADMSEVQHQMSREAAVCRSPCWWAGFAAAAGGLMHGLM